MKTTVETYQVVLQEQPKKKSFFSKFEDEMVWVCLWLFYIVAFLGVIPATLKATAMAWSWWWHLSL